MTSSVERNSRSEMVPRGAVADFRADIDGLRAIAIVLVVAYHAGVPGFTGGFIGVDVFFVISGYLITRILMKQTSSGSGVVLSQFWAKRIRRLVPALAAMVVVTLALSALILSPFEWGALPREAIAAGLYVSNIVFARAEVGYFDVHGVESPFLHTWSLGVEEQFYLLWPLLFVGVALLISPSKRRRGLLTLFGVGAAASFALSLLLTRRGSPWAFFSLPTRAWEFAAAGILAAVTVPQVLQRPRVVNVLYGSGILALAAAVIVFHGDQPYPGLRAIVPVAATLALLTAGAAATPSPAVSRALSAPPLQWLGRLSYSWYLWHWPTMVLTVAWLDTDTTAVRAAAGMAALLPAAAAHRWIENPMRFGRPLVASPARTFAMGLGATALVVGSGIGFARYSTHVEDSDGFRALAAVKAAPRGSECASTGRSSSGIAYCVDGDLSSPTTVMLIGDSHARQWIAAFADSAKRLELRLVVRARSVCPSIPIRVTSFEGIENVDCAGYRADTMNLIGELEPAAVVLSNYRGYGDQILRADGTHADPDEQVSLWKVAFSEQVAKIRSSGAAIGIVVDNPRLSADPLVCLSRPGNTEHDCQPSRHDALSAVTPFERVESRVLEQGTAVARFGVTEQICDAQKCDLRQGQTYVFVDRDHLATAWTTKQSHLIDPFLREVTGARRGRH